MSQPTGKDKASRIPLDYHRRGDPLVRTRLLLTAVAAFLAAAYVAWGFVAPGGAREHSHGPVAAVHATWDTQCMACHRDFAPIRDDAWAASWPWGPGGTKWIHTSDAQCQACHAGLAHSAREKPEEVASCSSCHREHQGRVAALTRMDDQHCTRCHGDLANHVSTATASRERERPEFDEAPIAQQIGSWQTDHPEFRSLKQDPGTIKFTHARHMSLGLRAAPDDRVEMKLDMLSPEDRQRYRKPNQGDHDLVQLDCSSCHQSDASPLAGLAASGDYMLPISYEQHCRACHPLTIDPQQPADLLPHGLPPDRIRRDLLGRLSESLLTQAPQEWQELLQRPVPSRAGERPPREPLDLLSQRVLKAERHLQRTCGKCHELAAAEGSRSPLPEAVVPVELSLLLPPLAPSRIPNTWLRDARFDHAAHRMVDCRKCHERAYADHPQVSKSNADVLIAGRETCLECHRSPTRFEVGPPAGARTDCAECHHYHAAAHHKAATAGRGEAP